MLCWDNWKSRLVFIFSRIDRTINGKISTFRRVFLLTSCETFRPFHRHSRWLYIQQQSSSSSSNRFIEHDVSIRKLGRNVVFNKTIAGRRRTLLLDVKTFLFIFLINSMSQLLYQTFIFCNTIVFSCKACHSAYKIFNEQQCSSVQICSMKGSRDNFVDWHDH